MRSKAVAGAVLVILLVATVAPGCVDEAENKPPSAVFETEVSSVDVGDVVVFDASNSSDSDGRITSFHWSFGDGDEKMGAQVHHIYARHGTYNVTLTVTDDLGKKSIFVQTIVVNAVPHCEIGMSTDTQYLSESIEFTAERSYDLDGSIASYAWDFGDGNASAMATVQHAYEMLGTYAVSLTVRDNRGATSTNTSYVKVIYRSFFVNFTRRDGNLQNTREYTGVGQATTVNYTVDEENLHYVRFRLTWRDLQKPIGGSANDVFKLTISPPDGDTRTVNGTQENLTLMFPLASFPLNRTVQGPDEGSVMEGVQEAEGSQMGSGQWTVIVEAVECGGFIDEQDQFQTDLGNLWDLAVHFEAYSIEVSATG